MLASADMSEVSMKTIRKDMEAKFGISFADRKEEIKTVVTSFIENQA